MSRAAPTARAPLSRDRILQAALESADANGIDALKMRDLARELGFEAMALYRHVSNKDAILEGLVDLVFDEIEPPPESADWAGAIRKGAISFHQALDRHPWAAGLLTTPVALRPGRLGFAESLLARLEEAGFPDEVCYHGYHVLDSYLVGYSLWLAGHSLTAEQRAAVSQKLAQEGPFEDYPRLVGHHAMHAAEGSHRDVSAFEIGLDLMLEGLKEMHKSQLREGSDQEVRPLV